ncbi:MAG: Rrf2 family transcriptional regulator [Desulfitobacterium sp.]|nr:Rrf2 family transcriptional regulator [Desulfitobacterium sp.]
MKISTKGRYGLRALVDLAVYSSGEHVPLSHIAERQNISENYLEQVFSALRKAGIINSVKGAQGGYVLAKKASDITVGRILRILEGELSVANEELSSDGVTIQECIQVKVWDEINTRINDFVDSLTLQDLVQEYADMTAESALMYYI